MFVSNARSLRTLIVGLAALVAALAFVAMASTASAAESGWTELDGHAAKNPHYKYETELTIINSSNVDLKYDQAGSKISSPNEPQTPKRAHFTLFTNPAPFGHSVKIRAGSHKTIRVHGDGAGGVEASLRFNGPKRVDGKVVPKSERKYMVITSTVKDNEGVTADASAAGNGLTATFAHREQYSSEGCFHVVMHGNATVTIS